MANITPRKNKNGEITSYTIKVFRGRDNNGKQLKPFITSYKPESGKTERQIKQEVKAIAADFEKKCKTGNVPTSDIKLSDYIPQYLDTVKAILSPKTFVFYKNKIDSLIIPALGYLKLKDIKPAHIQQFVHQLSAKQTEKENQKNTKCLSPSTVRRYMTIVQSIFKQAEKQGYITDSPAKSERLTFPKAQTPKVEIFTKQEAAQMLDCLINEPLQFQTMVQLAIYTGARRGELVALKFSDIVFSEQKITIERSAYKLKGEPIKTKPPKDYETRSVTVNDSCIELLKMLKAEKIEQAQKLGNKWVDENWIFTQNNGKIMNPNTPTKQFDKFLKKYNLKHRKFHSLRHTSATLLLYAGVNIKQVQGRLGHGDIKTTNKYLHQIEECDVEAVNKLDILLSPKNNGETKSTSLSTNMKKEEIS